MRFLMRRRQTLQAAVFGFLVLLALIAATQLADRTDDAETVDLRVRMWNIDDEAVAYVDCRSVLEVRGGRVRQAEVDVEPDAVVTVQVDNDRDTYSWGIRVVADDLPIMRFQRGYAEFFGANRNDKERVFETVFNQSVLLDGRSTETPGCLRI
jgi:hypothetical protein